MPESVLIAAMAMPAESSAVEELVRSLGIGREPALRLLERLAKAASQLAIERGGDLARIITAELGPARGGRAGP